LFLAGLITVGYKMQYFHRHYANSFAYAAVTTGCYSTTNEGALLLRFIVLYLNMNVEFLFGRIILELLRAAYQSHF